jgi:hypothetical protein
MWNRRRKAYQKSSHPSTLTRQAAEHCLRFLSTLLDATGSCGPPTSYIRHDIQIPVLGVHFGTLLAHPAALLMATGGIVEAKATLDRLAAIAKLC